jgi:hypothetical protein
MVSAGINSRNCRFQVHAASTPKMPGNFRLDANVSQRAWICGSLTEPDAGAASVLIDELDAGGFERVLNSWVISRVHQSFFVGEIRPLDRRDAHRRLPRKVFRAPPYKSSRRLRAN